MGKKAFVAITFSTGSAGVRPYLMTNLNLLVLRVVMQLMKGI